MIRSVLLIACLLTAAACARDKRYLVVSKVKQVAKLATTETTIDKIVFGTSDKRILGIIRINQARFAAYSRATIKSGIDLNKLTPEDVVITGKQIEVRLPAVEVINFSYPFRDFRIDNAITEDKFMNDIDIFDQEDFYRQAEADIRNNLQYTGIVAATETKTRLLMEALLQNLGYEETYITFRKDILMPELILTDGEAD
jgi:hypothetical protein